MANEYSKALGQVYGTPYSLRKAMARLISGQNPDGTPYSPPVLNGAAKNVELAYAEVVFPQGARGPHTTFTDLAGLSISFVAGERPVKLYLEHNFFQVGTINTLGELAICKEDNTVLTVASFAAAMANDWRALSKSVVLRNLTPGQTYTFKVRARCSSGQYGLGSTSYPFPTFLQAVEV